MQEYSLDGMLAMMMANRLLTVLVIASIVTLVLVALNWDTVRYFAMRVWHGIPLVGTVARLAREAKKDNGLIDENTGWRDAEISLCNVYYNRFKGVDKDPEYFRKCEDYLSKACEKGRRTNPFWVGPMVAVLLILEAVGFAYVLGPFINREVSANHLPLLVWSVATFLALISGFFAHIAGHQIHHNSLIKKARHWWRGTKGRDEQIGKDVAQISIDDTYTDKNGHGYNQILARIKTNDEVTEKKGWIVTFGVTILIVAIAAFWIRTEQLNALETDMVSSLTAEASVAAASASPFDLPAEAGAVAEESRNQSIQDKIDAEHRASLVTFGVLSVVYVAIQFIALWISIVFGFAGLESRRAYDLTSKFESADDMIRWMERQRMAIRSHADHKLRKLQSKISSYDMSFNRSEESQRNAHKRDFMAYVKMEDERIAKDIADRKSKADAQKMEEVLEKRRNELEEQRRLQELEAQYAQPGQTQVAVAPSAPVAVAPAATPQVEASAPAASPAVAVAQVPTKGPKASEFIDVRHTSDDVLEMLAEEYDITLDQIKKIQTTQLTLANAGRFPVKQEEPV